MPKGKKGAFNLFRAARGQKAEKTLLIMTGTACDNDCVFCSARAIPEAERTTAEIAAALALNRKAYKHVEFVGGEFTLRPDAPLLLRLCRKLGYTSAGIESNGKTFARPGFAGKLAASGLDWVTFSIHGARPGTHDALTRAPGAHRLAMRGLAAACRAAEKRPLSISVNYVVTRRNFREMPAMAAAVARLGRVASLCFSFVRPVETISDSAFKRLVPRFSDARPFLEKAMAFPFVTARSFPPCLADGGRIEDHREKLGVIKNYGALEDGNSCYGAVSGLLCKPGPCAACALSGSCLGIWKRYAQHYGTGELRPVRAARRPAGNIL
ncbi:MAG TPA: radical SAM protein [Elusimicrobiales bacterium]|nr:radical SAM protein [Elusimicrobiales bacterium]